jgi:DNA-binding NarL/FixJ family response regulator
MLAGAEGDLWDTVVAAAPPGPPLTGDALDAACAVAGDFAVRPPLPAGLTEREAQVLGLVAGGLTNRQVAARLGSAPKTVGNQLHSAYAKLGVSTRAAAALFAAEHDLLPRT